MAKPNTSEQPTYYAAVYAVTRMIPPGRVTNYGAIADYLALGSARMVGWALNLCHGMDDVPAHRVLNRKGELSGRHHFGHPLQMQRLLEAEGIMVENDTVVNFIGHFWSPLEALGLDWEIPIHGK
jgi:methylated-DNA-protein-cysteine methyltransferase related protein